LRSSNGSGKESVIEGRGYLSNEETSLAAHEEMHAREKCSDEVCEKFLKGEGEGGSIALVGGI